MSNQTIRVVARIVAIPEKVDEVRAILMELIEPTCQEEGCIKYELLQNQVDSTDFTFVEEWTSKAALDAHLASTHIAAAEEKLNGLIAIEPDIRLYKLLA
ncbi:MAG TPA: antibiotic biosynthesis monooxygenase [Cyanobacteria bacterium UBA11049]|nr:antibiotic biosynthesis monooxygenase [Cyanobacteria bacterium UBA11049]